MTWMQTSALGHFMRESGPWTYAIVNLLHILSVASLFGAVVTLDLRFKNVWREPPLAARAGAPPQVPPSPSAARGAPHQTPKSQKSRMTTAPKSDATPKMCKRLT